jgi:5,10-methylenetetrahydrofolate reductase
MRCQVGDLQKTKDKMSLEPNREIWLFFNIYIFANLMNRKRRKEVILAILILISFGQVAKFSQKKRVSSKNQTIKVKIVEKKKKEKKKKRPLPLATTLRDGIFS